MGAVEELAAAMRSERPGRALPGTVVAVIDAAHVRVSIGDRAIAAYGSAPVGAHVTVWVRDNLAEVVAVHDGSSAWTAPALTNGWLDCLAGVVPTAYRKVGDVVQLRGAVKSGTVAQPAFTLPVGFRPAGIHIFYAVAQPGGARIDVGADGTVTVRSYISSGTNALVSLSGIRYSTT